MRANRFLNISFTKSWQYPVWSENQENHLFFLRWTTRRETDRMELITFHFLQDLLVCHCRQGYSSISMGHSLFLGSSKCKCTFQVQIYRCVRISPLCSVFRFSFVLPGHQTRKLVWSMRILRAISNCSLMRRTRQGLFSIEVVAVMETIGVTSTS